VPQNNEVLVVPCREHGKIQEELNKHPVSYRSQPSDDDITKVWAFGLRPGGDLSYYVGLDWVEEGALALSVAPKIEGLDFHTMFRTCLKSAESVRFLGEAYDVRTEKRFIPCPDEAFDILPLLVLHFMKLLKNLLSKPLRKDYLAREENLKAKLKGKVLLSSHLTKNVFGRRPDRVMCRYQEFSVDCPENRLLHSAYRTGLNYLRSLREPAPEDLESRFEGIGYLKSDTVSPPMKHNPLYREYGEALRLARLIMGVQGYRDNTAGGRERLLPPYVINMAKLFELYAFALLRSELGSAIRFQSEGRYGAVDFLDVERKIVIDAKYKLRYIDDDKYLIEDIRQVAGYARDIGILVKLGKKNLNELNEVADCLILYPDIEASPFDRHHYEAGYQEISQFHRFRKLGIKVPVKGTGDAAPCTGNDTALRVGIK